jgi:hypothetical protein
MSEAAEKSVAEKSKAEVKAEKRAARVEKAGVIRDRGYQPYTGAYTPTAGRWRLVAGRMFAQTMRQWWVILVIILAAMRMLGGGVVMYLQLRVMAAMGGAEIPAGAMSQARINPNDSIESILVDGASTLVLGFFLALFVGGNAIVDDARAGAFQFYFARPLTKMQYLVGKLVPLLVVVGSVTLAPSLILALARVALATTGDEALHCLPLVAASLAGGLAVTLSIALPALALSATSARRGYAQGAYATLILLPWIAGNIVADATRSAWPNLLSIPANLQNVSHFLFRMPIEGTRALPVWISAAMLALVVGGSFALLRKKLEDIEVVQGS